MFSMLSIVMGMSILACGIYDIFEREADFFFFKGKKVKREESPAKYWLFIFSYFLAGSMFIFYGVLSWEEF